MMENLMPSYKLDEEARIFSRKFRITALLEFCIQPTSDNEMKSILSEFWHKFEQYAYRIIDFCDGDVLCMYALYYVYKHNYSSLSAVSRSFYAYTCQVSLTSSEKFSPLINYSFLKDLDRLTNIFCLPEERLQNIFVQCICNLNLGQLLFLVKYVSLDFPSELNGESRNIVTGLVNAFQKFFGSIHKANSQGDKNIFKNIDDFLNQLCSNNQPKHSNITCRRALLMFNWIRLVFEYHYFEKKTVTAIEIFGINIKQIIKTYFIDQFICLDILTETTTEPFITLTDIEIFGSKFLNFPADETAGFSLMDVSKKYLSEVLKCYTPKLLRGENECHTVRSLKDLTRCRIRQSLQHSRTLPEQVYQLMIPVALKEFLLFDNKEGIWKSLKNHQEFINLCHKV